MLDKLFGKNTGSLVFGSMSNSVGTVNNFEFKHIENSYDFYKEIKSYISKEKIILFPN